MNRSDIRLTLMFALATAVVFRLVPARADQRESNAPQQPAETVFLLGDAGEMNAEAANTVRAQAARLGSTTPKIMLFAGDNIYPHGLPDPSDPEYRQAKERLERQLRLVSDTGARALFVPGNHDWAQKGLSEKARVLRQAEAIDRQVGRGSHVPDDGCPGPAESAVSERFRVIAADSQWLSHIYLSGRKNYGSCPPAERFYEELSRLLIKNAGRLVIYMQHHTIYGATTQGPNYPKQPLLDRLDQTRPLICLAGHEHTLQVIEGKRGCRYYLVTGAMTNISDHDDKELSPEEGTLLFSRRYLGFMRLDLFEHGEVRLQVIKTGKDAGPLGRVTFERFLR